MNYISERLNEAAASRRRRLKWEKCKYQRAGGWGGGEGACILILRFITRHNCIFWLVHPFLPAPLADKPRHPRHATAVLNLQKGAMQRNRNYSGCFQVSGVIPPKRKKRKSFVEGDQLEKKNNNNFTYYQERSLFIPGSYQFVAEDGGFLIVAQRWTPHQDGKESFPCNSLKFKGTVGPVLEANSLFFFPSSSSLFFFSLS